MQFGKKILGEKMKGGEPHHGNSSCTMGNWVAAWEMENSDLKRVRWRGRFSGVISGRVSKRFEGVKAEIQGVERRRVGWGCLRK